MLKLYERIKSGGKARIKGLKVRDKNSKKTIGKWERGDEPPGAESDRALNQTSLSKLAGNV
jgi:hypothetical protein